MMTDGIEDDDWDAEDGFGDEPEPMDSYTYMMRQFRDA